MKEIKAVWLVVIGTSIACFVAAYMGHEEGKRQKAERDEIYNKLHEECLKDHKSYECTVMLGCKKEK